MKRRPRKFLRTLFVFLFLGAIVNVAVAWGFAIWEPQPTRGYDDIETLAVSIFADHGVQIPRDADFYATRMTLSGATYSAAVIEEQPSHIVILTEAGWPVRSLSGLLLRSETLGKPAVIELRNAIELSPRIRARNQVMNDLAFVLPLAPAWPGFAINTLFYAAGLWLLFFTSGAIRRTTRRNRGLCPACAYPVGASPVCTECGTPVASFNRT